MGDSVLEFEITEDMKGKYIVFGKKGCGNCKKTEDLLTKHDIPYVFLDSSNPYKKHQMNEFFGPTDNSLPQMYFVDEEGETAIVGNWDKIQKQFSHLEE